MNQYINNAACSTANGNTGAPGCGQNIKIIRGMILTPANYVFTDVIFADLQAKMLTATHAAVSSKVLPIWGFEGLTDNTEETTIGTSGYGTPEVLKDSVYNLVFDFNKAGEAYQRQLRKLNGFSGRAILVDEAGVLWGTKVTGGMAGLSLSLLYTDAIRLKTGSESVFNKLRVSFSNTAEFNEYRAFHIPSFNIFEITGLQDVEVYEEGGVFKLKTVYGGVDLYDDFADDLADPANWVLKNKATGAAITITGVTKDDANKGWDVAFTPPATPYTIGLNLAAPSVLLTAGVQGFEGVEFVKTVTA